jgi:hypothetical protein
MNNVGNIAKKFMQPEWLKVHVGTFLYATIMSGEGRQRPSTPEEGGILHFGLRLVFHITPGWLNSRCLE